MELSVYPPSTLLVGCGNMGQALLQGWITSCELSPDGVTVADPIANPKHVRVVREIPQLERFGLIVLAIKPQLFENLVPTLREVGRNAIVLSIMAGVESATLASALPNARIARIMANLSAEYGLSPVTLLAGPGITDEDRALLDRLGGALGSVEWHDDETLLHAVTALAGSGPGFVYRLLEAFAKGGAALGLEPRTAAAMALATVRGAAELAARSEEDFAALAARVASAGGTTRAGLDVLERDDAADRLIAETLRAARDRSEELGRSG
ncbi:MAG: NAD(P)-binding domain-containing protein [Novosphingobium sp.]|nr:NAD(P)-binding domain-containing protein [Novosphingobium sp.]